VAFSYFYDGFEPLNGAINPHPALKVSSADESHGDDGNGR